MSLTFEKRIPFYAALIVFLCCVVGMLSGVTFPKSETFFTSVITLGGIFSAFSVTIKSIVFSDNEKIEILKKSGYFYYYESYNNQAIDSSLVMCFLGLLGFFDGLSDYEVYSALVFSTAAFSVFSLRRITSVSNRLISRGSRKKAE